MGAVSQIKKISTQCWKPRARDDDEAVNNDAAVRRPETNQGSTYYLKGLSEVAAPAPVENLKEESVCVDIPHLKTVWPAQKPSR